jgi:hypothetical protein
MQELNLLIVLSENKTIGNLTEFRRFWDSYYRCTTKTSWLETENFVSRLKNIIPFIEKSAVQSAFHQFNLSL